MIWVGNQSAVIFVIRDTIIVIIMVTGITFSILVMVSLIGIGDIGAVIKIILMAIFIYVLVVVTLITYEVRIGVFLPEEEKKPQHFKKHHLRKAEIGVSIHRINWDFCLLYQQVKWM